MEEFIASPLVRGAIALAILLAVLKLAARLLSKPKPPPGVNVRVKCTSCGWTGTVGKYNIRCSSCNNKDVRVVAAKK